MKIITRIVFPIITYFKGINCIIYKGHKKNSKNIKTMGRLVQNHSTHIEGLIKWLKKIAARCEVKTVTPGSLSKTKGKGEKLVLRVTVKTKEGYKLLARKGKLVQEVFLVTTLEMSEILELIEVTNPKSFRKKKVY